MFVLLTMYVYFTSLSVVYFLSAILPQGNYSVRNEQ